MGEVGGQNPGRYNDIISATIDFITEFGVGRLRAADLAKRLGISTGLIFYHFETLDKLIVRAFEIAAERDLAHLQTTLDTVSDQPLLGQLRAVLEEYGPTGSALGWRLWIESWSASLHEPNLRSVVTGLDTQWRTAVMNLIDRGVDAGEFATADPRGAAWRLTSMLDGLAVQSVALGGAVDGVDVARWTSDALRRELGLPSSADVDHAAV